MKQKNQAQKVVRPSTEKREKGSPTSDWRARREVIQVLKKLSFLDPRCEARQKTSQGVTSMVEAGQRARRLRTAVSFGHATSLPFFHTDRA